MGVCSERRSRGGAVEFVRSLLSEAEFCAGGRMVPNAEADCEEVGRGV